MCICTRVYIYIYIYTCVYTHIYIHTCYVKYPRQGPSVVSIISIIIIISSSSSSSSSSNTIKSVNITIVSSCNIIIDTRNKPSMDNVTDFDRDRS